MRSSTLTLSSVLTLVFLSSAAICQQKGGEEETGAY